jgi:hypothetical protein
VQLRWRFETSDALDNDFLGWLIDDASVAAVGGCLLPTRTPIRSAPQGVEACIAFDRDADGSVAIGELIAAVNAALRGCPG